MATIVQTLPRSSSPLTWLREFLKEELAPYPGRAALVARMTHRRYPRRDRVHGISRSVCFPGRDLCAAHFTRKFAGHVAISGHILRSYAPRRGIPSRFSVVCNEFSPISFFVGDRYFLPCAFLQFSTLTSYTASVALAIVISVGIPLWDRHVPAETSVEDTLWLCWSIVDRSRDHCWRRAGFHATKEGR